MRSLTYVAALAIIWVLLWGSASPANVLSGLAVSGTLVLLVPGMRGQTGGRYTFRPIAFARFVGYVLLVTLRSNLELIREVLSRSSGVRTAVIGVPLPGCSDEVLTLITNLLAMSPGTMPLELRQDPTVLYIHVLTRTDIEIVRRDILRLTDLTVRAFESKETIADQDAYMRAHGSP
jgi:multicomponent Na+:H+ antiporter subunit E